ncbi:BTAD domain-containing putative transcriptional regulator [Paracraurococcus lichenis]|uniref:BTAD domain-containing putative transcriptional regulator n=1 Tax=Paracraurococcus lichenis TaxID=3064888 RepID=A0ABT9E6W5_9PROT|nr:BTAD domain-containing putative transcriptional regulator [Paracraurococcus sp. LOR1-02]MDO9711919.1 BTAD domain-containing putative transcriptional regulator [Paracraurococcus sp. LOR1-02]
MSEAIQIRMLGPFEARRADGTPIAPPGRRSVALLACLALPDEAVSTRPRLAALLWHDRGAEQANGSLRQELLRLRKAFGAPLALPSADPPMQTPRLGGPAIDLDVHRFEAAAADPARASEAASLYRGPLLEGFPLTDPGPFPAWVAAQRLRLHELALGTLLRVLRGAEASEAIARRLLELDPLCEEAVRYLIRAHAGRGDLGRAQATFQACLGRFRQMDREPSRETRSLMELAEAELSRSTVSMFAVTHGPGADGGNWIRVLREGPATPQAPEPRELPIVEDRPSIAVLPFSDLTSDAGLLADPFADGITEETTNALARMPGFFVTSRHSAMAYRGAAMDARLIALQLGVRYLLEGSVERAGARARSNVRLIDGRSGLHIWADSVGAPVDEPFEMRDRLVGEIAARLQPRLLLSEVQRTLREPPPNPDAWTWLLRAQSALARSEAVPAVFDASEQALRQALAVQPDYAMAHAMLSLVHTWRAVSEFGSAGGGMRRRWQARKAMARALALAPDNPFVLSACSEAALYSTGDIDRAAALLEGALRRDPNDANALALLGNVRRMAGDDPHAALTLIDQAMRLSPRDPRSAFWLLHAAWCHWKMGEYEAMEEAARQALALHRANAWAWVCLTCSLGLQGRQAEAREAALEVLALMPGFSTGRFYWTARFFYGRRFAGPVREGYRGLHRVLKTMLG